MATTPLHVTKKNGERIAHAGHERVDVGPFVPFLQRLVAMSAIETDAEIDELLNPKPDATRSSWGIFMADVARQFGEMADAHQFIDAVLEAEPDLVPALKVKIQIHQDCGDGAEARALVARVKKLAGDAASPAAISEEEMDLVYEVLEGQLFDGTWGESDDLRKAFRKWARKAFPDHAEEQSDVTLLEGLIGDEEGGGVIAGFVNGLPAALQSVALAGIRADVGKILGKKKPSGELAALLARIG